MAVISLCNVDIAEVFPATDGAEAICALKEVKSDVAANSVDKVNATAPVNATPFSPALTLETPTTDVRSAKSAIVAGSSSFSFNQTSPASGASVSITTFPLVVVSASIAASSATT